MSVLIATTLTPDLRTGPAAAQTLDGHADFALVPDGFDGLDGLEFASWLGPLTTHLGLVPEVRVTHLEPFHTATASATLDYAARSRAGLAVGISHTAAEAELFGRREPAPALAAWAEAGAIIDVIRRLWDSWDDDAIIRDQATGRYIDRDRLHRVGAQLEDSTGTEYSVLGPSITPRPPQGHPPIVVRAEPGNEAARAAADIVLVDEAAGEVSLEELRSGLDPAVAVLTVLPAPRTRAQDPRRGGRARRLRADPHRSRRLRDPPERAGRRAARDQRPPGLRDPSGPAGGGAARDPGAAGPRPAGSAHPPRAGTGREPLCAGVRLPAWATTAPT